MPNRIETSQAEASKTIYFNEANVWVTEERFTNGMTSFEIDHVTDVAVILGRWLPRQGVLAFLAGLVLLPFFLYVGLAVSAASVMYCIAHKQEYVLLLSVDGEDVRFMASADQAYLKRIYSALVEAMRARHARLKTGKA